MNKDYVDFDTIKEDYTVCEVENGQILRVKQSVINIFNITDEKGEPKGTINTKTISNVDTPTEIDTSNLEYAEPSQVTERDQVKELKFKIIKEPTNVYETKRSIILIFTHITNVFLTSKKDKTNAPILRYTAIHDMGLLRKPTIEHNIGNEKIE